MKRSSGASIVISKRVDDIFKKEYDHENKDENARTTTNEEKRELPKKEALERLDRES